MQRAVARWNAVPLRARLVGIVLALLLTALAATGYGVQRVLSRFLVGQMDTQLIATAHNASTDEGFLNALIDPGRRRFPSPFIVQVSIDGRPPLAPVSGYTRSQDEKLPTFPAVTSARAEELVDQAYAVRAGDGTRWRATTFPAAVRDSTGSGEIGASVTILQSLSEVDAAVTQLRLLMLLIGAAALATSGLLGWLAIRRGFIPLREVEVTAAAIAAGDLSQRIPERPESTEVGRLTSSLNGMLTQIEGAFRAREASEARTRRFAADASHELRTPLASIRGFAELYRQGAVPAEEVPRTLQRIEDEAKRMGGLVEDLLLLARLDEQRPTRSEPVDLAVLAGDAVHDVRGLDAGRTVRLVGLGAPDDGQPTGGSRPPPRPWATRTGCARWWPTCSATPCGTRRPGPRSRWRSEWTGTTETRAPCWRCATTDRDSTPTMQRRCSSGSTAPTRRAVAGRAAGQAWACRSSRQWSARTAARCWCARPLAVEPRSRSASPPARGDSAHFGFHQGLCPPTEPSSHDRM